MGPNARVSEFWAFALKLELRFLVLIPKVAWESHSALSCTVLGWHSNRVYGLGSGVQALGISGAAVVSGRFAKAFLNSDGLLAFGLHWKLSGRKP